MKGINKSKQTTTITSVAMSAKKTATKKKNSSMPKQTQTDDGVDSHLIGYMKDKKRNKFNTDSFKKTTNSPINNTGYQPNKKTKKSYANYLANRLFERNFSTSSSMNSSTIMKNTIKEGDAFNVIAYQISKLDKKHKHLTGDKIKMDCYEFMRQHFNKFKEITNDKKLWEHIENLRNPTTRATRYELIAIQELYGYKINCYYSDNGKIFAEEQLEKQFPLYKPRKMVSDHSIKILPTFSKRFQCSYYVPITPAHLHQEATSANLGNLLGKSKEKKSKSKKNASYLFDIAAYQLRKLDEKYKDITASKIRMACYEFMKLHFDTFKNITNDEKLSENIEKLKKATTPATALELIAIQEIYRYKVDYHVLNEDTDVHIKQSLGDIFPHYKPNKMAEGKTIKILHALHKNSKKDHYEALIDDEILPHKANKPNNTTNNTRENAPNLPVTPFKKTLNKRTNEETKSDTETAQPKSARTYRPADSWITQKQEKQKKQEKQEKRNRANTL
ncbi:hypothetical protein [Abyssalbus ytuae]|uniref:Uncharacterized protein n=1 Tax=Abyssalbus ytuae TaxID=2926907 RepID=A0A9E6ZIS5_9FLAO|nr:hypothetical protein [Abyssalbus ytuae]UOB16307.1 hypothetical protein MQE35_11220 [Abyssalbus ytuae]